MKRARRARRKLAARKALDKTSPFPLYLAEMPMKRILFCAIVLAGLVALAQAPAQGQPAEDLSEEAHPHSEALEVATEDAVLKEQIRRVNDGLAELHMQLAARRKALQQETDPAKKSALYSELDGLRKEHDMLERLLHELVEEARATEWTQIDEALRKIKSYERRQEHSYEKEEALRERQQ